MSRFFQYSKQLNLQDMFSLIFFVGEMGGYSQEDFCARFFETNVFFACVLTTLRCRPAALCHCRSEFFASSGSLLYSRLLQQRRLFSVIKQTHRFSFFYFRNQTYFRMLFETFLMDNDNHIVTRSDPKELKHTYFCILAPWCFCSILYDNCLNKKSPCSWNTLSLIFTSQLRPLQLSIIFIVRRHESSSCWIVFVYFQL